MPKETRSTIRPTVVSRPVRKKDAPEARATPSPEGTKGGRPVAVSAPTAILGVAR